MSKNSIIPFLKNYLINFLTSPFLLDTNEFLYKIYKSSYLNPTDFYDKKGPIIPFLYSAIYLTC